MAAFPLPLLAPWLQNLTHSQLGGHGRGLCSLVAKPSANSGHAEAQVMAARELRSRGKLLHVICNNKVALMPRL